MPTSLQSPTRERSTTVPVLEVFASIQGEGLFVGEPQVFLRLGGCPLRCRWCDTPHSWPEPGEEAQARIGTPGAHRAGRDEPAWATPFQVATWIAEVEEGPARTVSVTGGEPLLHPEFLVALGPFLGERSLHLETAGAHPDALARVLDVVDHVSLDLKLPADLDDPVGDDRLPKTSHDWARTRREVLQLVARAPSACAKLIVSGGRTPRDYAPLLDDLAARAPGVPLILQPVTPLRGVESPDAGILPALVEEALERGLSCRVIPQVHRVLGMP